jgi:conjugative transfer region protein TrbK
MNIRIVVRGIGYLLVAGGLLGAEIALTNRPYPTAKTSTRTEASPAAALDAELAHCQAIGAEAADDATCKAVGEADRRRIVESAKLYRDRVTDSLPAMPDANEPASPSATELPTSAPPSRSMPDSNAPQPAADIAEQPQ